MYYDVRSELVFCSPMHCKSVESQTVQTLKNGKIALKPINSYTNASKCALILQFLKISLGFGNLWDHLGYVLSHICLEIRFLIKHGQF